MFSCKALKQPCCCVRHCLSRALVVQCCDAYELSADELSRPATPAKAAAQDAGAAKPRVLTPNANMDMHGRIAAANSQLNAFTASLTAETAAPTVSALLAAQVCLARHPSQLHR